MLKKIAVSLFLCGGLAAFSQNLSVVPVTVPPSSCYPIPIYEYQAGSTIYISGPGNTCVAISAAVSGINQLTGDVTAGPGTGSQAASIAKISGSATIPTGGSLDIVETGTSAWGMNNANGFFQTNLPNDGSTPTVVNETACENSSGNAQLCGANTKSHLIGAVVAGAGSTGYPEIAVRGNVATLTFDATHAVVAEDWVVSSATAGLVSDTGSSTYPTCGNQIVGVANSSGLASTTQKVLLRPDTPFSCGTTGQIMQATSSTALGLSAAITPSTVAATGNVSAPGLTMNSVVNAAAPTSSGATSGGTAGVSTTNEAALTCLDSGGNTTLGVASANVITITANQTIPWTFAAPTGCANNTAYLWMKASGTFAYYTTIALPATTFTQSAAASTYTAAASYPVGGAYPAANTTGQGIFLGNVGIGTTSPGQKLEVNGDIFTNQTSSAFFRATAVNNNTLAGVVMTTGNGGSLQMWQCASNASGSNGEFSIRDSTASFYALTILKSSGNLGLGTGSPTNILSLSGTAARTIWMERNTTAATAGQGLTLSSGGAIAGTADLAGGDLTLQSGIATGVGSSAIHFFTATAGASATTDRIPTEKMTILGSGNVGIGTTNPSTQLHVSEASGGASAINNITWGNGNGGGQLGATSAGIPYLTNYFANSSIQLGYQTTTNTPTTFTPVVTVTNGNVGIGTTSPTWKFSVNANTWGVDSNGITHQASTAPTCSSSASDCAVATYSTNAGGEITGLSGDTSVTITFANSGWTNAAFCVATGSQASDVIYNSSQSKTSVTFSFSALTGNLFYHCDGN